MEKYGYFNFKYNLKDLRPMKFDMPLPYDNLNLYFKSLLEKTNLLPSYKNENDALESIDNVIVKKANDDVIIRNWPVSDVSKEEAKEKGLTFPKHLSEIKYTNWDVLEPQSLEKSR